jgi:hypothetical protein
MNSFPQREKGLSLFVMLNQRVHTGVSLQTEKLVVNQAGAIARNICGQLLQCVGCYVVVLLIRGHWMPAKYSVFQA